MSNTLQEGIKDSILNSVKKLLGIPIDLHEFDPDITMNINAAIFTLRQIGIGLEDMFIVIDDQQTYTDYLGEGNPEIEQVKMYLYYKTRLSFDPPTNGSVAESMKEFIQEAEWRLKIESEECKDTIEGEENDEDGLSGF